VGGTDGALTAAIFRSSAPGVPSGPPLLTILDELPRVDRNYTQPLRLPIAEKYKVRGRRTSGKTRGHAIAF